MEPLFLVKRSHLPTYCLKYDFSGDCILSGRIRFSSNAFRSRAESLSSIAMSNWKLDRRKKGRIHGVTDRMRGWIELKNRAAGPGRVWSLSVRTRKRETLPSANSRPRRRPRPSVTHFASLRSLPPLGPPRALSTDSRYRNGCQSRSLAVRPSVRPRTACMVRPSVGRSVERNAFPSLLSLSRSPPLNRETSSDRRRRRRLAPPLLLPRCFSSHGLEEIRRRSGVDGWLDAEIHRIALRPKL